MSKPSTGGRGRREGYRKEPLLPPNDPTVTRVELAPDEGAAPTAVVRTRVRTKTVGRDAGRRREESSVREAVSVAEELRSLAGAEPLPGEVVPLSLKPGRSAPVTEDEALGIKRRQARYETLRRYRNATPAELADADLPATVAEALAQVNELSLSPWDSTSETKTIKMHPRVAELVAAYAELVDVSVSSLITLLVWRMLQEAPVPTAEWQRMHQDVTRLVLAEQREEQDRGLGLD